MFANKKNVKVGDTVLIPLEGEWMHEEQIMLEHEVVLALRCKVPQEKQITQTGQPPLPVLREFHDDIAIFPE